MDTLPDLEIDAIITQYCQNDLKEVKIEWDKKYFHYKLKICARLHIENLL